MTTTECLLLVLPLATAIAACEPRAGDSSAAATTRVDTVAGVVHVTHSGDGVWVAGTGWRADMAHAIEIGAVEGPEAYVFGRISGVVVGQDGRIYVGDWQAMEVRVFSPEGEFMGRFGREGEGPGEFRSVSGLGRVPGGGVAVLDPRAGLVDVFDVAGEFERSFPVGRKRQVGPGLPVRFDQEGKYYDLSRESYNLSAASIRFVDSLRTVRYGAAGAPMDTVFMAVDESEQINITQGGRIVAGMALPFAPHASGAIGPAGEIYATLGDQYEIARLGSGNDTLRTLRRMLRPVPITAAERDSATRALVDRYTERAGAAPRDLPALPVRRPAIQALQVDETGHLWVLRGTGDASVMEWDVFDAEGAYLGVVTFPTMRVRHIGENTIAGVVQDDLGVERVRVIPILRE